MTALPLCKYLLPIVVAENVNDDIRITHSTGDATFQLTPGTYYLSGDGGATDLSAMIASALQAQIGYVWSGRVSGGLWGLLCDTSGLGVDWDYSDPGTFFGFDGGLLGVTDTTATFTIPGAAWVEGDAQHQRGWYASQPIEWDDGDDLGISASQSRAKSGRIYTHQASEIVSDRPVRHAYEPSYKAKELYSSGYENQSFQAFWRTAIGECVRFYADASLASYVDKVFMGESLTGSKPARYHHGVPVYSWQVLLGAYV